MTTQKDDTAFHIPATRVVKALSRLREMHGDMTILQAMMFFRIASEPGVTQSTLWRELDTYDSVASRSVAILSSYGVKVRDPKTGAVARETKPLNLIEVRENPENRREKGLSLTNKGRKLMQDIISDLGLETGRGRRV